jgi:hypothetical protein
MSGDIRITRNAYIKKGLPCRKRSAGFPWPSDGARSAGPPESHAGCAGWSADLHLLFASIERGGGTCGGTFARDSAAVLQ